MTIFGGSISVGAVGATESNATSSATDGSLAEGSEAMADDYKTGPRMWKGPLDVREEVPEEEGNTFLQTDAGPDGDLFKIYHYDESWEPRGVEAPAIRTGSSSIGPNNRDWGDRLDLFAVGGQSNAQGSESDPTATVDVSEQVAIQYDLEDRTIERPLDDPFVESEDEGSAWTAFARRYYQLTGVKSAYFNAAEDGSAQHDAADSGNGTWDWTGRLRSRLVSRVEDARTAFRDQGYDVCFRGILWLQGERDAQAIDDGTITKLDYKTAFENMVSYYDGVFSDPWNLYLFEVGHPESGDTSGFQDVRAIQRKVARSNRLVEFVSGAQKFFPGQGLMIDELHWGVDGLTIMGETGAKRLIAGNTDPGARSVTVFVGSGSEQRIEDSATQLLVDSVGGPDPYDQADLPNNQLTVDAPGEYRVSSRVSWPSSGDMDGASAAMILQVGGVDVAFESKSFGTNSYEKTISTDAIVEDVSAGDSVTAYVRQDSGSPETISQGQTKTYLSLSPVSAVTDRW